jgi:drug/metabolite transporter (DMT)-like permease
MLMIFGLALLALALWCAYDLFVRQDTAEKSTTWYTFNYSGLVLGGLGAVYAWILAAIRSKKGIGTPTDDRGPAENRPKES